jgi:predicted ABC-type transport system involved in lysophospholipase L1 biosynthesis ATPase subunit
VFKGGVHRGQERQRQEHLLSLLGALDKPASGDVLVNGVSLAGMPDGMPDGKLTEYRRRDIGFVFQQFNLSPNLSAVDNVMLPMEFAGIRKAARRGRAKELLEQVQLDPDKHIRRINRLSGGEPQRMGFARALANEPERRFRLQQGKLTAEAARARRRRVHWPSWAGSPAWRGQPRFGTGGGGGRDPPRLG